MNPKNTKDFHLNLENNLSIFNKILEREEDFWKQNLECNGLVKDIEIPNSSTPLPLTEDEETELFD